MNVEVCDGPGLCDVETLVVSIRRNFNPPVFTSNSYEVTIGEDTAVLTEILRVTARDTDLGARYNQVTYRMQNVNEYFSIEKSSTSNDGLIRVKKPLTTGTTPNMPESVVSFCSVTYCIEQKLEN